MLTLLQAVQTCLQYSGSFEVNSIFDTDESERTARLAREVYYRVVDRTKDTQFDTFVGTLDGIIDTDAPNYLALPDAVRSIQDSRIRYNVADTPDVVYRDVQYVTNQEFLDIVQQNRTGDNVQKVIDPLLGAEYLIRTDKHPEYCTSFNGKYIAFDSYDSSLENTLHEQKSLVVCNRAQEFLIDDAYVIPLPQHLLQGYQDVLLNEYYEVIVEESKPSIARRAQRFVATLQQDHQRIGGSQRPVKRYGRR